MRHSLSFSGLDGLPRGLESGVAAAVTASVRANARMTQDDLRRETYQLGNRLPKTWRVRHYPPAGDSLGAAALIWTKAPKLIDAFDRGVEIRVRGKRFLAIPTAFAGKMAPRAGFDGAAFPGMRGRRMERVTPAGFERRSGLKLRPVFRPGKDGLLVADNAMLDTRARNVYRLRPYRSRGPGSRLYGPRGRTFVVFILKPSVKLPKRLDIDTHARAAANRAPGLLAKHWR